MGFTKLKYNLFFVLLLTLKLNTGLAQEEIPSVVVQARATETSIKLRWAVNSPSAWHFANTYGYTIERITISEGGKTLKQPVRTLLTERPLKPADEKMWQTAIDEDDYVAVAAQAIFGETFELSENYSSDIMQVVNKAKELESRFSFALFSADQSIKAAELSGLYYEDETIAAGKKYLYRIYVNISPETMVVDTASVFIGMADYRPLPKLMDVEAKFDDHRALISWNGALLERIYSSFWVERLDDDGETFYKITERPIVNTYQGDAPRSRMIFKVDSLPQNNKTYHYRVIGINAFGETGPPSDTVSGAGLPVFAYSATILDHEINEDGHIRLEWDFPENGKALLKSFDLLRIDQLTKVEEVVLYEVDPVAGEVVDESPHSTNYYVLRANDIYGRNNNSFPYLVQLEDSIPPAPPVNLVGTIDSLGRVQLSWDANKESDLKGYKVFKSNFRSEQFIQVPGPIWETNSYVDTIKLNNLTEKIYYKVRALDNRFNASDFSAVLELKKPDLIPPVPPVFKGIRLDSLGIFLAWEPSGSEDVKSHMLYRRSSAESQWTLIEVFEKTDTTREYIDKNLAHRTEYSYTMLAVDDDQLESTPAVPLTIKWMAADPYPVVDQLFYNIDKEKKKLNVSWVYDQQGVEKFMIYKAVNDRPLKLFKTLEAGSNELEDRFSLAEEKIEYRVVASFKSGDRTRISKALVIKI